MSASMRVIHVIRLLRLSGDPRQAKCSNWERGIWRGSERRTAGHADHVIALERLLSRGLRGPIRTVLPAGAAGWLPLSTAGTCSRTE
jgi:hypothetical protein